jgi:F-box-like
VVSADTLPDDVLLAIFHHYLNDDAQHPIERGKAWQSLVHVCRRWRSIIFASPRHLDLQLVCQERTGARDTLDVWPALPLVIWCHGIGSVDNIIAVLERRDRVCQINLWNVQSSDLEILLAAMQQPFPELRHLSLHSLGETVPVVTDSFLGGSAPRLEFLQLNRIPIPGLLKLLLSSTHLVDLYLTNIPHSVYIAPDMMVTILSKLTSLEELTLTFQSPRSCPALQELTEGRTMEVLPALQNIFLEGLESSGPVQEGIGKFVAARQVASRPMAVSSWANSDRDKGYYQSD